MANQAGLEQKGGLGILVLLGILALALMPRKKPEEAKEPGAATVSGSISNLKVEMGTHLAPKAPGAPYTVSVYWVGETKDAAGLPRAWGYRLLVGTGMVGESQERMFANVAAGGTQISPFTFTAPTTPGATRSILVTLQGLKSDAAGSPTADWMILANARHDNAIIVQAVGAQVAGSITSLIVAQRHLRRFGL